MARNFKVQEISGGYFIVIDSDSHSQVSPQFSKRANAEKYLQDEIPKRFPMNNEFNDKEQRRAIGNAKYGSKTNDSNSIKYQGKYYSFRWDGDTLLIWYKGEWKPIKESEVEKD